jgi:hypothetical protein
MIEAGNRLRFTVEPGFHLGIVGEMRWKDFDGNRAIQTIVASLVDFPHAASADGGEDLVRAEFCA